VGIIGGAQGQRIALVVLALLMVAAALIEMTCRRLSSTTSSGPTSEYIDRVRQHRPVTRLVRPPLHAEEFWAG
jgi:hypothetical protein